MTRRLSDLVLLLAVPFCGCRAAPPPTRVILATTTSVEDSGLLDALVPAFEAAHPEYTVQYTAVGSGQALELGRRGDADVLITHSPGDELQFMAEGHGTERRALMYNEFVVLGPASDPAGVRSAEDAAEAFQRIAETGARFLSRGDQSGTHRREQSVWQAAQIEPGGDWYTEAGVGMGDALGIASERQAYILSDMATWLYARDRLDIVLVHRGDPRLVNQYSVLLGAMSDNEGAVVFVDWLTGAEAQTMIAEFGRETTGQQLFVPNAGEY